MINLIANHSFPLILLLTVLTAILTYPMGRNAFETHVQRRRAALKTFVGGLAGCFIVILSDTVAIHNLSANLVWAAMMLIGNIVLIELLLTVSVAGVTVDGQKRNLWRGDARRDM